jgi:hypothetical protein
MTTGQFLSNQKNLVPQLRRAAELPLSRVAANVLADPDTTPEDIVNILNGEADTDRGFWRIALAALLQAANEHIDLPDLPSEAKVQLTDIASCARQQNPGLYGNEAFLQHCLRLIAELESENDAAAESGSDATPSPGLRRVASSRFSGSLRFSAYGAHPAIGFNLIDESGDSLFDEEIMAEDMLFIAHSVLSGTRKTLENIVSNVPKDRILCTASEDDLRTRAEEMKRNLDVVVDQLLSFNGIDKASD